ncbi:MAG TPA: hypothetical protein VG733_15040 [Chthoniobacteraceae bacterium]|nr:hypothetical protein [Chthoniobacteraceae bacterium]
MELDLSAIFDSIQELTVSDRSIGDRMKEIIVLCERDVPHRDWAQLSSLEYDKDVSSLTGWIPGVFKKQPAPFPIQALWIGLCNPCTDEQNVWADMYVAAMGQYIPDDDEFGWLFENPRHYPKNAYAQSSSLRSIYEIGYNGGGGLENDAEWPLCLAFGAFAIHRLLQFETPRLVGSSAMRIGVVVGFDSGDTLKIGELTENGLVKSA